MVDAQHSEGGMTAQRFNAFILAVCALYQPANACFVIDNAPAHRQAGHLQLPQNLQLRYLPPYSPMLNICENAFSVWKADIKQRLAEVREMLLGMQQHDQRMVTLAQISVQGTAVVTPAKMHAAFMGMQGYLPACFGRQNIYM